MPAKGTFFGKSLEGLKSCYQKISIKVHQRSTLSYLLCIHLCVHSHNMWQCPPHPSTSMALPRVSQLFTLLFSTAPYPPPPPPPPPLPHSLQYPTHLLQVSIDVVAPYYSLPHHAKIAARTENGPHYTILGL